MEIYLISLINLTNTFSKFPSGLIPAGSQCQVFQPYTGKGTQRTATIQMKPYRYENQSFLMKISIL